MQLLHQKMYWNFQKSSVKSAYKCVLDHQCSIFFKLVK